MGWRRAKTSEVFSSCRTILLGWPRFPDTFNATQYTSADFGRALPAQGFGRRGGCWGIAAMDSFFFTLKTERTSKTNYASRDHARVDVFDLIERFQNPRRRHSTLQSPPVL